MPNQGAAIDHARATVPLENVDLFSELLRQPDVVGVEEGDVAPAGLAMPRLREAAMPRFWPPG